MVCRPTRKAARISVRTEREALEYAVMPASARLITSTTQTKPIRRNRGGMQSREHAITRYQFIPVRAARFGSPRSHPVALTEGSKADCPCRFAAAYYHLCNNRIAIMLAFMSLQEAPIRRS